MLRPAAPALLLPGDTQPTLQALCAQSPGHGPSSDQHGFPSPSPVHLCGFSASLARGPSERSKGRGGRSVDKHTLPSPWRTPAQPTRRLRVHAGRQVEASGCPSRETQPDTAEQRSCTHAHSGHPPTLRRGPAGPEFVGQTMKKSLIKKPCCSWLGEIWRPVGWWPADQGFRRGRR